jgi:uncharacterized damage-inducible protein DinB
VATEIERLEDQLRRSFAGDSWHGPSLSDVLADVSAETACARPIGAAHTIWEIVHHLIATYNLVLRRMRGNPASLTPEEDWPAVVSSTPSAWQETLRKLREVNEELRRELKAVKATGLDHSFAGEPYTAYAELIGITQHDLYHAGQIVMLKKAVK